MDNTSVEKFYQSLSSIGVAIYSKSYTKSFSKSVDIESTLIEAAHHIELGLDRRILSLILSWIREHGEQINMERLRKLSNKEEQSPYWINLFAFYGLSQGQSRWKILAKPVVSREFANEDLEMAKSRLEFKGEEVWSKGTGFLIPLGSEPIDSKYVLSAKQISSLNVMFKCRLIWGANWKADIYFAMIMGAKTANAAAKAVGSSYDPAYRVYQGAKNASFDPRIILKLER